MAHLPSWQALVAAATGSKHLAHNRPSEDAHAIGGWAQGLVLAVADGAGSARYGRQGAQIAVQAAVHTAQRLHHLAMPQLLAQIAKEARKALEGLVGALEPTEEEVWAWLDAPHTEPPRLRDFATTLLVGVIGEAWVGVLQVGDGVVVAIPKQGAPVCLTHPVRGEYANQTIFITSDNYPEYLQTVVQPLGELSALVLMSDGVEQLTIIKATNTPHPPFFFSLLSYLQSKRPLEEKSGDISRFLASDKACERNDDDKTLLVAFRSLHTD